jgi:hypothetical protein
VVELTDRRLCAIVSIENISAGLSWSPAGSWRPTNS